MCAVEGTVKGGNTESIRLRKGARRVVYFPEILFTRLECNGRKV